MIKLAHVVAFVSGSPQFRITEAFDDQAPLYTYYGQPNIEADLVGIDATSHDSKRVRTFDDVHTLYKGEVVFSLISGKAAIVGASHQSYLYTQNYVKLITDETVDAKYLVYLLNEDQSIKKQFQIGLQGSQVLKYTLKQVKELVLPNLLPIEKQRIIGALYFNQLRLEALRNRAANAETTIVLTKLREVSNP